MSNSAPRTVLRSSIVPCVQSFGHLQHLVSLALLQPQCSLLQAGSFNSSRHRTLPYVEDTCETTIQKPAPSTSCRILLSLRLCVKMATPETFSETGSDATMYEKV